MTQHSSPQQADCSQVRVALGVYVLGTIDPDERALVDEHLATCEACLAELADLADLPALLALVPAEDAIAMTSGLAGDDLATEAPVLPFPLPGVPPQDSLAANDGAPAVPEAQTRQARPSPVGPSPVQPLQPSVPQPSVPELPAPQMPEKVTAEDAAVVDLAAARRKRRRRLAGVGAVAAAAVVIGAASFGGARLAGSPAPAAAHGGASSSFPNGQGGAWEAATGNTGGAAATVDYRPMGWGIQLEAKVVGIPIDTPCQMWVIKRDGSRVYAGSWITDSDEGTVWYPAAAATSAKDVRAFMISVSGGQPITVTPT